MTYLYLSPLPSNDDSEFELSEKKMIVVKFEEMLKQLQK